MECEKRTGGGARGEVKKDSQGGPAAQCKKVGLPSSDMGRGPCGKGHWRGILDTVGSGSPVDILSSP